MSQASAASSSPVRKTIAASMSEPSYGRQVQRRQRDQVPQLCDRRGGLSIRAQPRPERLAVERGIRGIERAQRGSCAKRVQTLSAAERRKADERRHEVERRGQRRSPQERRRLPFAEDRHAQSRLDRDEVLDAQALEEAAVRGAAAEQHVLPVVDPVLLAAHRVRRSTEPRACVEERDARAVVGEIERRRDPGEAAADDRNAGAVHAALRARLCARTRPFSQRRSVGRPAARARDGARSGRVVGDMHRPWRARTRRCGGRGAARASTRARGGSAHAGPRTQRAARPDRRCVHPQRGSRSGRDPRSADSGGRCGDPR